MYLKSSHWDLNAGQKVNGKNAESGARTPMGWGKRTPAAKDAPYPAGKRLALAFFPSSPHGRRYPRRYYPRQLLLSEALSFSIVFHRRDLHNGRIPPFCL